MSTEVFKRLAIDRMRWRVLRNVSRWICPIFDKIECRIYFLFCFTNLEKLSRLFSFFFSGFEWQFLSSEFLFCSSIFFFLSLFEIMKQFYSKWVDIASFEINIIQIAIFFRLKIKNYKDLLLCFLFLTRCLFSSTDWVSLFKRLISFNKQKLNSKRQCFIFK